MALLMVHLLVASLWAEGREAYRDCPEFYYGVISPDAIHIRDGGDKSHKDEIHLHNWREAHPEEVLAYWRKHHEPFDIGYGVHVLTDGQWVPRYRERLPGMMRLDGRLDVDRYYNDTFVTDFGLYRGEPRLRRALELIERAETPSDHPMLGAYEFDQWRQRTLEAYRSPCPYSQPVRFIDEDYVRQFARDSLALIDETFDAI